jgi:hypothetical protein
VLCRPGWRCKVIFMCRGVEAENLRVAYAVIVDMVVSFGVLIVVATMAVIVIVVMRHGELWRGSGVALMAMLMKLRLGVLGRGDWESKRIAELRSWCKRIANCLNAATR